MDVRKCGMQVASPDFRFAENFINGLERRRRQVKLFQKPFNIVDLVRLKLDFFPKEWYFTPSLP